jgi:hypothetical protein
VQGEAQRFVLPYTETPTRRIWAYYAEVKQTLNPRWYVASRAGLSTNNGSQVRNLEGAAGFRPDSFQLLKIDYEIEHRDAGTPHNDNTLAIQFVTTLHVAAARR